MLFVLATSFIVGAIVGSFLNVVILRLNTGESLIFGGSYCFSCGKKLRFYELIPIVSFIFQKGRCLRCKSAISWQYPLIEILMGILFVVFLYRVLQQGLGSVTSWINAGLNLVSFTSLFLLAAYDMRTKFIDSLLLRVFSISVLAVFLFQFFVQFEQSNYTLFFARDILVDVLSSGVIALFFFSLWFLSSGKWMGGGDWMVAFWCALLLGFPANAWMILISFWVGGAIGVFLLLTGGSRWTLKAELPFAPFLSFATFLAWLLLV